MPVRPVLLSLAALAVGLSGAATISAGLAAEGNDYPTQAIADYVFGCMKANGETRDALIACSCSVDVVASVIPYDRYEEASTFLSMQQVTGENAGLFRESAESKAAVGDLRRAQAEGEIRCFKS